MHGCPRGIPLKINEYDSPILVFYGNIYVPDDEPVEVNGHVPNLIVLNDRSKTIGGYVQGGDVPPSPSIRNEE